MQDKHIPFYFWITKKKHLSLILKTEKGMFGLYTKGSTNQIWEVGNLNFKKYNWQWLIFNFVVVVVVVFVVVVVTTMNPIGRYVLDHYMKAAIWCILESISRGFPSLAGRKQSRCLQTDKKANKAKAFLRSPTNTHSFFMALIIWLIINKNFLSLQHSFQLKVVHPLHSLLS